LNRRTELLLRSLLTLIQPEMVFDSMPPNNPHLFAIEFPDLSKKLATGIHACRSKQTGEGFASPSKLLRSKPRPSSRGSNLRTASKGGVSNRSWFYDEYQGMKMIYQN
jgi:hypothetical protein